MSGNEDQRSWELGVLSQKVEEFLKGMENDIGGERLSKSKELVRTYTITL